MKYTLAFTVATGFLTVVVSSVMAQTKVRTPETDANLTYYGPVLAIGGTTAATSVAFSPDSKEIAVAYPGSLWFGDALTGQNTDEIKNLPTIRHICYSPDGNRVAAACDDKTVKLFDAKTHKLTVTLKVATNAGDSLSHPGQLAFSADGKILAVIDSDEYLTFWSTDRGQLKGHFGSDDNNGQPVATRSQYFSSVVLSSDGKHLGAVVHSRITKVGNGGVYYAQAEILWLTPNGRVEPGPFSYDQIKANPAAFSPTLNVAKHAYVSIAQSTDGRYAALSGHAGSQIVLDLKRNVLLDKLSDLETHVLGFTADNSRLIASSGHGQALVFDMHQQRLLGVIGFGETGWLANCIALSPDGKRLSAGGAGVRIFDVTLLKDDPDSPISPFPFKNAKPQKPGVVLDFFGMPHLSIPTFTFQSPERILAIAPSPDGKTIAAGTEGKSVLLFDRATGKQTGTLDGHKDAVTRLKYAPKGGRLVTGSVDGTHIIWDVDAGKSLAKIPIPAAPGSELVNNANQLAISLDGTRLAIVTPKGVSLWDLAAAKSLGVFATEPALDANADKVPIPKAAAAVVQRPAKIPYTRCVGEVAFAPDGTIATIASSASGTEWELGWRNAKGIAIAPPLNILKLQVRNGYALMPNMAFSPDGNLLAVMGRSRCDLYDLQTKQKVLESGSSQWDGHVVGFSADGDRIIITSHYQNDDNPRKLIIANHRTKGLNLTIDLGQGVRADSVALSADGRWLVVADTYRIRIWDVSTL